MKKVVFTMMLLLCTQYAYAAQCKFTWTYATTEEANIEGFKLYNGLVSGQYVSSITIGKTLRTFSTPCIVNAYYAMTAYKTGMLESDFSNEVQVRQVSVKVTGLTMTIEVTIP